MSSHTQMAKVLIKKKVKYQDTINKASFYYYAMEHRKLMSSFYFYSTNIELPHFLITAMSYKKASSYVFSPFGMGFKDCQGEGQMSICACALRLFDVHQYIFHTSECSQMLMTFRLND